MPESSDKTCWPHSGWRCTGSTGCEHRMCVRLHGSSNPEHSIQVKHRIQMLVN